MSLSFPDHLPSSHPLEPPEVHIYRSFDRVVACAREGIYPDELFWPQCVAIDPATNHIYIAQGRLYPNFARLSRFAETGEYIRSFTHKNMKSLHGIAIHNDNLYVTDWKLHCLFMIKILESDFRIVAKIGSRGCDLGQFKTPLQLSIANSGDLYIADYCNDRIQVIDSSLHLIKEINHRSLNRPRDVKLIKDEIFVLSEQDNPCVHVFTYTGQKIRSLIERGIQVRMPYCFCLDDSNSLIISDWGISRIRIFSKDGSFLHELGDRGEEVGMFLTPKGLALTSNFKLVTVSANGNYGLQIFSML